MEALRREQTDTTPAVELNPAHNVFEILGSSRPEDVREFYYPIMDWLAKFQEYVAGEGATLFSAENPLTFTAKLHYFNSSSAKFIFDIFEELQNIHALNIPVKVYWYFDEDDEDMLDVGEEISQMVDIDFQFIAIKND
jgi:hypothetical protein